MKVDYLIVGAGLTGSVIARMLSDQGREVVVVEKRDHIGGNVFDYTHSPSGVRIHKYGPHYFRTQSDDLWRFVNKYSEFVEYKPIVKIWDGQRFWHWPVHIEEIAPFLLQQSAAKTQTTMEISFEDSCLSILPKNVYNKLIKGYTTKQWGIIPNRLHSTLASRIQINSSRDYSLTPNCKYQGLPKEGYGSMMNKMLAGIEVITCFDYLQRKDELGPRKGLVYTGPIDAYFNFSFGKLRYRSQRRVHHYHKNMIWAQPYVQINYSNYRTKYIRAIEWKHLPGTNHNCKGTVQTFEYPFSPDNGDILEYPFPDDQNIARSMQYLKLLQSEKNVYARGRLAEYKYLDMDAAIDNARLLASRILRNK